MREEVSELRKSQVGRWAFGLFLSALIVIVAAINGFFLHKIDMMSDKMDVNFKSIDTTLSNMSTIQSVMSYRIESIEKRNAKIDMREGK